MLLYLHIPYCDSKCHYCSFNSYVDRFDTRKVYMKALYEQLQNELERFEAGSSSIETLFIGGGTPSTIDPELYQRIFELVTPYLTADAEITTEANPNSADRQWLQGMKELGINRVSFGVQSFDSTKLKVLNRAHDPKEAIQAIETAYTLGIEHLSLDLIYNVRGDTKALLNSDIEQAFSLPIDHISAYELTIEPETHFAKNPSVKLENEALARFVSQSIDARGFAPYEISNFGTYQSRHNRGYWQLKNYIGAGAGAVGFLDEKRFYPRKDIDAYLSNPLIVEEELLSVEEFQTEKIFLGLRSTIGVSQEDLGPEMRVRADYLVDKGKLLLHDERYQNPDFFLADELALYLLG